MQTDQCQDPTGDKPPTTEADLETQTGKEESCALEEKNTKLVYSANRGSAEWTYYSMDCVNVPDVSGIMSAITWSMGGGVQIR